MALGSGAVASGVKTGAFDFFLLLFYTQVVGVDARLVGLAIFLALLLDAVSDPIVGYWSDNLRSSWGRRHPFMYAAALPVSLGFYFLWNPPQGASEQTLFWYLLTCAVVIRTAITFFETPSSALIPELTQDYHERTKLFSLRYLFGWVGGNSITVMMFVVLFPMFATQTIVDGRFNQDAYALYGLIGSAVIFVSIGICSIGTHAQISILQPPPPKQPMSVRRIFQEVVESLSEKSFVSLFSASLIGSTASGLASGLSLYFVTYFWGFTERQTGLFMFGGFFAAMIGYWLAPKVSLAWGKKRGAMIVGFAAFVGQPLPIVLRLLDVLPPNDSSFTLWLVVITNVLDVGLIVCYQILFSSMVADLVEQSELKTGRRSEGVFTAAVTFTKKSVQGLGVMAASLVLALANFPAGGDTTQVSEDVLWQLGAYYVPIVLTLWMSVIAVISTYRIDESTHEANLIALQR